MISLSFIVLLPVFTIILNKWFKLIGIEITVAVVAFGLPLSILVPKASYLILASQLAGILNSVNLFRSSNRSDTKVRVKRIILLFLYLSVIGLAAGYGTVSLIVALQGIKILLLPLILSLGAVNPGVKWNSFLKYLVWLSIIEDIASIVEYKLGVIKLMQFGLHYGSQLRQIEGQLRPPALFSNHFEFGLFSAAVCSVCIICHSLETGVSKRFIKVGIFFSGSGVVLSTARTAFLLVALVFILNYSQKDSRLRVATSIIPRFFVISLISLMLVRILPQLGTAESTFSRFSNWREIIKRFDYWLGHGIGAVGGATSSNFANPSIKIIVDNYILSLFVQLGFVGLMLFVLSLFFLVRSSFSHQSIIIAILVSCLTLETWEYYSPMMILLIFHIYKSSLLSDCEPK